MGYNRNHGHVQKLYQIFMCVIYHCERLVSKIKIVEFSMTTSLAVRIQGNKFVSGNLEA